MLDTDTCSFILRRHSQKIIDRLADVSSQSSVIISAVTYSEMRYGEVGSKAPANLESIIKGFVKYRNSKETGKARYTNRQE